MTKPDYDTDPAGNAMRRDVVIETYISARNAGGPEFMDGQSLFGTRGRDTCTVDTCHPNDFGFMRMVEAVYPVLKKVL